MKGIRLTNYGIVSIITPSYNASKFIAQTIESVSAQTYPYWEMIIIDDNSSDNSVEIAQRYISKDNRIKLIKLYTPSGASIARNTGIKASIGRFIAFLDSDDIWLPNKLERQIVDMIDRNLTISYTAYKKMDEAGCVGDGIISVPTYASYNTLLNTNYIACLTAIYDSDKCGKKYMPDLASMKNYAYWVKKLKKVGHEDYGFWLSILKTLKPNEAGGINEALAVYRVRKSSLSGNKLKAALYHWLALRKIEKLPFPKAVYHFMHYIYFGYKKHKTF